MEENKRFQKKNLNSDDNAGMEKGARAAKGGLAGTGLLLLALANRKNLKEFGKGAVKIATQIIKKI